MGMRLLATYLGTNAAMGTALMGRAMLAVVCCCCADTIARGQFTTTYNVPPNVAPSTIFSNTQLNVFDGGAISNAFAAGDSLGTSTNVQVNVFGGTVGGVFSAYRGSEVNI